MAHSNLSTPAQLYEVTKIVHKRAQELGCATVQAYVQSDRLEERREVMQRWCDYVELCLRGGADLLL